ncbi:MAG: electron transfer flavoprotein subunit beta/FixA family protein [Bryobacteraceae bacterium]|nr:electron transfer flavoprotein subunit beta/FixA family protein [Bryobacteraceae bacterium]
MRILVAVKQVIGRDAPLRVNAARTWVEENDATFEINEPDAYALEAALQLKEKHGGEVAVLCAGPERAAKTIREALAKGADRAVHIELPEAAALDALGTASLLARAAEAEKPDLVLTGLQSDDLGLGQTGVVMAERMGLPHATIIMEIDFRGAAVRVKRELEGGWFQYVEMPVPAVLTIQSGIAKLRYATLMGIKKARSKEIKTLAAADLGIPSHPAAVIERLYMPPRARQAQIVEGTPQEKAARLVDKLRTEARVL